MIELTANGIKCSIMVNRITAIFPKDTGSTIWFSGDDDDYVDCQEGYDEVLTKIRASIREGKQ